MNDNKLEMNKIERQAEETVNSIEKSIVPFLFFFIFYWNASNTSFSFTFRRIFRIFEECFFNICNYFNGNISFCLLFNIIYRRKKV